MNPFKISGAFPLYVLVAAIGFLFSSPQSVASVPGDEHWDDQFGPVGTDGQLYAVTALDGRIYVGGIFQNAGNTKANFIAGYDGTNWFQLNNGVAGGLNTTYIFALANDGTNIYAGGWFTNADNSGARYIARWDGSNWWPLPGGSPNSIVETIKIVGTNFFVGGVFTTNGGVPVNGIARWDGSNWLPLGGGVSGAALVPGVLAIEYDGTYVYAGGTFNQAGAVNATNIARWDGSTWSSMGNPFSGSVLALARVGTFLYAGGNFTNVSLRITNFAKWDGSSWLAINANNAVHDLLSDGTNLYAAGDFTSIGGVTASRIAKWDGNNWLPLGNGLQGFNLSGAKMTLDTKGRLILAGNFNQADGIGVSYVAGWNGTNWFALGGTTSKGMSHFLGQVQGLYSDGTNLYAGGTFTEGATAILNGIGRWDGTNWHALGSVVNGQQPSATGRAFAMTSDTTFAAGALYVGGGFTNVGGVPAGRIARWDGNNWANIGDADSSVRALAWDGNNLWVGGIFTNIGGQFSPGYGLYWPGIGWFNFGSMTGGSLLVNAIASDGNTVYMGGNFTAIDGVNMANIAKFNGDWSPLGTGVSGTVNAIAVTNGMVYVGGSFTAAGGVTVNRIAMWNGNSWSALGSGLANSSVSSIVCKGGDVYVGGTFTNAGGVSAFGIAKWNGTSWSALGSGLFSNISSGPGSGLSLATIGNDVFVGGNITSAGDKPSSFIARWNDQLNFYPPPHPFLARSARLGSGAFQFRLSGTSGESYILQASTDLTTWVPLFTNTVPLFDFVDTNAGIYPHRFYRAALGP